MSNEWERRTDAHALSRDTLAAMLRLAFPGRQLETLRELTGGLANGMWRVTLAGDTRAYVLRVYLREAPACAREVALLRLVAGRLPVPDVIYVQPERTVAGYPYAVLSWLDGEPLDAVLAGIAADEAEAVGRAVGATLAALGTFRFEQAGFLDAQLQVTQPLPSSSEFIGERLTRPVVRVRLGEALAARLGDFVAAHARRMDTAPGGPALVHADFREGNLLLARAATGVAMGWRVTALLDWEFALAATPLFDLATLLRWDDTLPPAFALGLAQGYTGAGGSLPLGWRETARLLDLVNLVELLDGPVERPRHMAAMRARIVATLDGWKVHGEA